MPAEKIRPSIAFVDDRMSELRSIVPEAFGDGSLNWDVLRDALGVGLDDPETPAEHFGLNWPGKRNARQLAAKPSRGTLVPVSGDGVNEEASSNIFIEGDNLEALKLLQKSYASRIKLVFIDPPYNTGSDFVYRDDFTESRKEYLQRSGQSSSTGELQTTNPKSSGRFHSNWLSMMYPRLRLARTLLREDGVIFVSIDSNEVHNLRLLMDEVFGEENFVADIVWQHSVQPKGYLGKFSVHHNYLLCYRRTESFILPALERTEEHNVNYTNPDNDPNGPWRPGDVRNALYRRNLIFDIQTPTGKVISPPPNGWRWSRDTINSKIATGEIIFNADETRIIRKIYLKSVGGRPPETIWFGKDVGTTRDATGELKDIFGGATPFDTPKPTALIKRIIQLACDGSEDIVLDFFAGSATTADAVLQSNVELGTSRRFIVVQLDEPVAKGSVAEGSGFRTVAEIGKERIRRVLARQQADVAPQLFNPQTSPGFRVFRLALSNFLTWNDYEGNDLAVIRDLFQAQQSSLVDGWTQDALTTEVVLLEGFPLDSKIESHGVSDNTVRFVTSPMCAHRLLICLDPYVSPNTLTGLKLSEGDVFICLDSALDDNTKLHLTQAGMLKTI